MGKNKGKIFFWSIIIISIILIGGYIILKNFYPTSMYEIKKLIKSNKFNKNNTISVSSETYSQKFILYEDKQKLQKYFPKQDISAKTYYNIYGKIVVEGDEYLDLSNSQIDNNLIEKLKPLTQIKKVNLKNQNINKDTQIILQQTYPNIDFIWQVDVLGKKVDWNIETLDLSNQKIEDIEDFKKSLTLLKKLKTLDMSNTNLSNETLGNLRELYPNIRIDWVVYLGKWSVRTDAIAFSVLITQYDYKRMSSADIQVLKYCTELQALDLGHQAIEDISVIGEYLPNLRILILADNKIKDISCLSNLKHLHYLELFMNDITDASALNSCKELVDLNISFNYHFSDINGILELPMLERLWLISDKISADSYNLIKQTYPNVKLVTTGSGSTNSGWRTHERYFAMIDMFKKRNYMSEVFSKYDK